MAIPDSPASLTLLTRYVPASTGTHGNKLTNQRGVTPTHCGGVLVVFANWRAASAPNVAGGLMRISFYVACPVHNRQRQTHPGLDVGPACRSGTCPTAIDMLARALFISARKRSASAIPENNPSRLIDKHETSRVRRFRDTQRTPLRLVTMP